MTQPPVRLTYAEVTCLRRAALGETIEVIARQIDNSPEGVEALLASAREKLFATTTVEAVARAIKLGLID